MSSHPPAPSDHQIRFVLTTVATVEQARDIASALVQQRLAACVQRTPIESVYRWEGAVRHEAEQRLLCKTTRGRIQDLLAAVRALHPYDVPALHVEAPTEVDPAFAAWIAAQVAEDPDEPGGPASIRGDNPGPCPPSTP